MPNMNNKVWISAGPMGACASKGDFCDLPRFSGFGVLGFWGFGESSVAQSSDLPNPLSP